MNSLLSKPSDLELIRDTMAAFPTSFAYGPLACMKYKWPNDGLKKNSPTKASRLSAGNGQQR